MTNRSTKSPYARGVEVSCPGCGERIVFLTPFHTESQAELLLMALSGDQVIYMTDQPIEPLTSCCHRVTIDRPLGYNDERFDVSDTDDEITKTLTRDRRPRE